MRKITTAFVFILIVGMIALLLIPYVYNNYCLYKFSKQLSMFPFPDEILIVEKRSVLGKLNGNGNGMEYCACVLVKSTLDTGQINEVFMSYTFSPARSKGSAGVEANVLTVDGPQLNTDYVEHENITFQSLLDADTYDDYYVIFIYDGGYSTIVDIRGH